MQSNDSLLSTSNGFWFMMATTLDKNLWPLIKRMLNTRRWAFEMKGGGVTGDG